MSDSKTSPTERASQGTEAEDYLSFTTERSGAVLNLYLRPPGDRLPGANIHWELAEFFSNIRGDNSIRIIVVTGISDGVFMTPPSTQASRAAQSTGERSDAHRLWKTFTGVIRFHEAITSLEKPVIAKVNGDAIGFGQSIMFACDLIVSREDARIADSHLALGEISPYGTHYGLVPGDGGMIYAPLYMHPAIAKEYLMLAKPYTGRQLADMGIINYAVPLDRLDRTVDEMVEALLRRPSYALAWTKRLLSRPAGARVAELADAAAAYEMVNFLEISGFGWADPVAL